MRSGIGAEQLRAWTLGKQGLLDGTAASIPAGVTRGAAINDLLTLRVLTIDRGRRPCRLIQRGALMDSPGDIAGPRLRSFVERIERLDEEIKALSDDKKDIYAE